MSSYLESRVAILERALENLVECFNTSGQTNTLPVYIDGELIEAEVEVATDNALETALMVLYDEKETTYEEDKEADSDEDIFDLGCVAA